MVKMVNFMLCIFCHNENVLFCEFLEVPYFKAVNTAPVARWAVREFLVADVDLSPR